MVTKLRKIAYVICFCPILLVAQQDPEVPDQVDIIEEEKVNDTWTSPFISDEMTVDDEQNKSWRMGDYSYSSKPRHSWEFGLHFGHFAIDGDTERNLPSGFGAGLHLRKAVNYFFSIRTSFFYGMANGLGVQPNYHRNVINEVGAGGGLIEDVFDVYNPDNGGPGTWFVSYQTQYISGDVAAIFNIGNVLFHQERNRWNIYVGVGLGLATNNTRLDLLGADNNPYENLMNEVGWTREKFNTSEGKKEIRDALKTIYDGTYETEAYDTGGIFSLGDNTFRYVLRPSIGVSRKINKRVNLSLEHRVSISDSDYLDGKKFRTTYDITNNLDVAHYTSFRIGFNIGNFNKVTEPLYWVNPLDQAFNDLTIAKNQTQLDLVDEDNDGVIDIIDQELDTPEDCPVDTRGILLDSDGDGIADCEDREPYSRPGCQIDEFGIGQCDDGYLNEGAISELIDSRLEEFKNSYAAVLTNGGVASSNYTGPVSTRSGTNPDGSTYILTMPTDNDGNIIASDRATKIVTNDDGSTYEVVLPIDEEGNFVASDRAIRTGTQPNGDEYLLISPVDDQGNFVATSEATKIITDSDGQKYVVTLPLDDEGNYVASTTATKTVSNPDGSGYVLTLPVDNDGNFVATQSATKTVVNPDGSGYILTLPVDANGNFIATNEATKTVRKADGTISKFKVPVDNNGEILTSGTSGDIPSGNIASSVKAQIDDSKSVIAATNPQPNGNSAYNSNNNTYPSQENSGNQQYNQGANQPSKVSTYTGSTVSSGCGDWFLPMIHYDLNKSAIKPEYYSHLHNVAQVMKKCPDVCVVAQGHTDTRSTNEYNRVLSYLRAKAAVDYLTETYKIDRSRIKLMYGGEENPMVLAPSTEAHHFMNRRVEFRTCESNDFDMAAPEGANKIESSKSIPEFYQGAKNSGY